LWVRFLPGLPLKSTPAPSAAFFKRNTLLCGVEETTVAKEDKKGQKAKKPNTIRRYFREMVGELRKVSWPTRQETINLTIVVLIVLSIMTAFLGTLDVLASRLFGLILGT
jgi:preprotein translocase subunit SecE